MFQKIVSPLIGADNQNKVQVYSSVGDQCGRRNASVFLGVVLFLFSRYRVDKSGKRILGALCGLKYVRDDENRPVAVFPDHDMEICADVEFTLSDASKVRVFRFPFPSLFIARWSLYLIQMGRFS